MIVAAPTETPVATPEELPTETIEELDDDHVPPENALVRPIEDPTQTSGVVVLTIGPGVLVTSCVVALVIEPLTPVQVAEPPLAQVITQKK